MSGRGTDEPVAWYCHMRLKEMLSSGVQQKRVADLTGLPASAINVLVRSARGAGPTTAAALVKLFGFKTRGELVDAADAWWEKEGQQYAIREMRTMLEERSKKAEPSSAPPAAPEEGTPRRRRQAG